MKNKLNTAQSFGRALIAALALGFSCSAGFAAESHYYVNDPLATTVAIADSAGEIAAMEADAFGAPLAIGEAPGRFTGKPYDADLGAFVFPFRNYRPEEGRWMSADPSGFPDGVNQRNYASDPLGRVDPLGLYQLTTTYQYLPADQMDTSFGALGRCNSSYKTSINASVDLKGSEADGFFMEATVGFSFHGSSDIFVSTAGSSARGGLVDSTSFNQLLTHERDHRDVFRALLNSVFLPIETWSASYTSNRFKTEASARAASSYDLGTQITNIINNFLVKYSTDSEINHEAAHLENGVWRLSNPNWNGNALEKVSTYKPNFSKRTGDFE